jgi:adenosylhomocysteinase
MGAHVVVTEVCPQAALKAVMDGFRVMSMHEAARIGEIFITATGMQGVIRLEHLENMRNGAIVCNTGHYDCEIEISGLETLVEKRRVLRAHCEELTLKNGRTLYLLAQGRLVNLAAAEGHPSEVMDMSFANQFLGMIYMAKQKKGLNSAVYPIPPENDVKIARIKLETMGITIDTLTAAQQAYTRNYLAGT